MNKSILKLLSEMKFKKMTFPPSILKSGYSTPTLIEGYGALYYLCDRAPTTSEPDLLTSIPDFSYWWVDQLNNQIYWCLDNTSDAMIWHKTVFNANINTSRGYSDQSNLGFNASRQPSLTNDTLLSVSVMLNNTLLTTSEVEIKISPDNSDYTTIGTLANLTEDVSSNIYCANPTVPAGYYYQLATSGSGTQTLINLQELPQ